MASFGLMDAGEIEDDGDGLDGDGAGLPELDIAGDGHDDNEAGLQEPDIADDAAPSDSG
jgi:hypothetical protein